MKQTQQLTAIIEREDNGYVGLCPELDIASQGDTIESARSNLQEAVELFRNGGSGRDEATTAHRSVCNSA
jgi:predicted RNase H-like HicB family nuclease